MHHANLLVGSREWAVTHIPEEELRSGPDVLFLSFDRMTIADARALIHDAHMRPVERAHRTFILECATILPEAQNTLLKLFEEPDASARFFLVVPREDALLPTLRSRFHLIAVEHAGIDTGAFETFQKAPYAERLAEIARRLDSEDATWIKAIVNGAAVHAQKVQDPALIRDVLTTESYIAAPGSSKKMLLEHLALAIPAK